MRISGRRVPSIGRNLYETGEQEPLTGQNQLNHNMTSSIKKIGSPYELRSGKESQGPTNSDSNAQLQICFKGYYNISQTLFIFTTPSATDWRKCAFQHLQQNQATCFFYAALQLLNEERFDAILRQMWYDRPYLSQTITPRKAGMLLQRARANISLWAIWDAKGLMILRQLKLAPKNSHDGIRERYLVLSEFNDKWEYAPHWMPCTVIPDKVLEAPWFEESFRKPGVLEARLEAMDTWVDATPEQAMYKERIMIEQAMWSAALSYQVSILENEETNARFEIFAEVVRGIEGTVQAFHKLLSDFQAQKAALNFFQAEQRNLIFVDENVEFEFIEQQREYVEQMMSKMVVIQKDQARGQVFDNYCQVVDRLFEESIQDTEVWFAMCLEKMKTPMSLIGYHNLTFALKPRQFHPFAGVGGAYGRHTPPFPSIASPYHMDSEKRFWACSGKDDCSDAIRTEGHPGPGDRAWARLHGWRIAYELRPEVISHMYVDSHTLVYVVKGMPCIVNPYVLENGDYNPETFGALHTATATWRLTDPCEMKAHDRVYIIFRLRRAATTVAGCFMKKIPFHLDKVNDVTYREVTPKIATVADFPDTKTYMKVMFAQLAASAPEDCRGYIQDARNGALASLGEGDLSPLFDPVRCVHAIINQNRRLAMYMGMPGASYSLA